MKKRTWVLGFGGLMAAGVATVGILTAGAAVNSGTGQISSDRAKEIAMEHAGIKAEDVSYSRAEKDYDDGRLVYEVKLWTADLREYEYQIGAEDGAVEDFDYDGKAAFRKKASQEDREAVISEERAKEIALDHAGLKEEEVSLVKSELDYDDGIAVYEIEFYGKDYREYDYEISAGTGEIIGLDWDAENYDRKSRPEEEKGQNTGSLTMEEAKKKALQTAGVTAEQAERIRIEQDWDDGRMVYEGEFVSGTMEYEFEIDGETGRVLDWDAESIYD